MMLLRSCVFGLCISLYLYLSRTACTLVMELSGVFDWFLFLFFKQKTAYEMRISDWSSDVCSSDLGDARCQSISARPVDKLVTTLILEALSPAAIDVSL